MILHPLFSRSLLPLLGFLTLCEITSRGDVVINEFSAGNLIGLRDESGEAQDWIELHNRGTNAVDLLGWSLTDDRNALGKWTFLLHFFAGSSTFIFATFCAFRGQPALIQFISRPMPCPQERCL